MQRELLSEKSIPINNTTSTEHREILSEDNITRDNGASAKQIEALSMDNSHKDNSVSTEQSSTCRDNTASTLSKILVDHTHQSLLLVYIKTI